MFEGKSKYIVPFDILMYHTATYVSGSFNIDVPFAYEVIWN